MLPELDDAAQQLVPATHTLGLIFILNCKAGAVPLSQPHAVRTFCDQCRRMLNDCDPAQVHLVPGQFVAVCTKFAAAAIAGPPRAVAAIATIWLSSARVAYGFGWESSWLSPSIGEATTRIMSAPLSAMSIGPEADTLASVNTSVKEC